MGYYTEYLRDVDKMHNVAKTSMMKYPIFDEGYRTPLNRKILDHFWMREIAHETPDMFLARLRIKLNEIMPYYNQLYKTEQLEFDPLSTIDMRSISEQSHSESGVQESDADTKSTSDSTGRAVNSEFPQEQLRGDGNYATNASDSVGKTLTDSEALTKASTDSEGRASSESRQVGRVGNATSLLMEFRASLLNIDMMVVEELEPLFMQLHSPRDFHPSNHMLYGASSGMFGMFGIFY